MKRLLSIVLIFAMLFLACACGTEEVATAVRHYAPDTEATEPTDTQILEPVETTQQPIDGFRKSSNTEYEFENIIYSIPSYFGKEPKHSSDIGRWFFAEDNGEALAMLLLVVSGPPNGVDLSNFNSYKNSIANDIMNGEAFSNVELLKTEVTTMADLPAQRIIFNCTYDGCDLTMSYTYAYDPSDNMVKYVGFGENDKCVYNYFDDIEKIVNTAEHETIPTPTPTPTPTQAPVAIEPINPNIGSDSASIQRSSTVCWTPNGECYHLTSSCRTLSRSKTILSGTVSEAGGRRQCNVCG